MGRRRHRFLLGAGLLVAGNVVSTLCTLVRNVVLVRALTQVDYGIATTFSLTIAAITSASQVNPDALMIQAKEGGEPEFQRVSQLLRFAQGALRALVMLLLAPVLCRIFKTPEVRWVYSLLALVPLLEGLGHLDSNRYQRELRYLPHVLVRTGPELVSLLVVWAATPYIRDYSLVVISLLARELAGLIASYACAERRYGWSLHRAYVTQNFHFGWPLFFNSLLMLLVNQGDRILIGSAEWLTELAARWLPALPPPALVYDKVDLALYAIAAQTANVPQNAVASIVPLLFLPILSGLLGKGDRFARSYGVCLSMMSVIGAALAGAFILCGTTAVTLMYEERYAGVAPFIGWLGVAAGLRVLRMGPTVAAYACGDTKILLLSNLLRSTLSFAYLGIVLVGLPLEWISHCLVFGELVATATTLLLVWSRHGIPLGVCVRPCVFLLVWLGIDFALADLGYTEPAGRSILVTGAALFAMLGSAAAFVLPWEHVRGVLTARGQPASA